VLVCWWGRSCRTCIGLQDRSCFLGIPPFVKRQVLFEIRGRQDIWRPQSALEQIQLLPDRGIATRLQLPLSFGFPRGGTPSVKHVLHERPLPLRGGVGHLLPCKAVGAGADTPGGYEDIGQQGSPWGNDGRIVYRVVGTLSQVRITEMPMGWQRL
jgi:hypothetical protein